MHVLMCTVFWGSPRSVRDVTIPTELREAPGFRGASVLVNERSSKTALITWWESIEALKNASQLLGQKGGFITAQEAVRGNCGVGRQLSRTRSRLSFRGQR